MTPTEVHQTISRLRRDMPRNKLAMDLCDAAEEMLLASAPKGEVAKFDKKAYQREYMRKRRKAEGTLP